MQTALVTGATSGIGRAMARALQGAGYGVLALGRNAAALKELADQGIETLALDLCDPAGVRALARRRIDVLVNNAGIMPPLGAFDAIDPAEIDRTLAVNVSAVLHLTRVVVPQMRARKAGHLVFTGSTASYAPGANFALYAASKAAVSAFAAGLRGDLSGDGIRVTELVPGRVETALYAATLGAEARAAMYDGHSLQPEDVAEALLAVLRLPPRADIARLDILPTRPVPAIQLK